MHDDIEMRVLIGENAKQRLAIAAARYPEVLVRVLQEVLAETKERIAEVLPDAVLPERLPHWEAHCLAVHRRFLQVLAPKSAPEQDPEPDLWLLVASCLLAHVYATMLEYRIDSVPKKGESLDDEEKVQTHLAFCFNPIASDPGFQQVIAWAVIESMRDRDSDRRESDWMESAIVDTATSAHYLTGGPTPELVETVVREQTLPREAWSMFGASKPEEAKQQVSMITQIYELFENERKSPLSLPGYAAWLGSLSRSPDPLEGLRGKWLTSLESLIFLYSPPVATAIVLRPVPNPDWTSGIRAELRMSQARYLQRQRRFDQKAGNSLDALLDSDDADGNTLHDISHSPQPPESDRSLDQMFRSAGLTEQEQRIARLKAQGYRQNEIAGQVGLSEGRVSQILRSIKRKLDDDLDPEAD